MVQQTQLRKLKEPIMAHKELVSTIPMLPPNKLSQKIRDYFLHGIGTKTKLKETNQSAQSQRVKSVPTMTNISQLHISVTKRITGQPPHNL